MRPKFGIVVLPGSNCDHDAYYAVKHSLKCDAEFLWHKDTNLKNSDVIILPGGFSYGDYLRVGAIAKFSPIMDSVLNFAEKGGIVLGICNGFQILLESGLLPGVMLKNNSLKFVCKDVYISVENKETIFTNNLNNHTPLKIPVAHGEGNYFADKETLNSLIENNQVVFRYSDSRGNIIESSNPNGSVYNIAGIINKRGNVLGMMPHPERACSNLLHREDGKLIFSSIINNFIKRS